MIAIGYVRVSTEGQAKEGVSLDAQQAKITAWCLANGYELGSIHVDAGISGARASNRPALQAAIATACREKAPLVVYSLSRFARSTTDTIVISDRLSKSGADLVSLSEKIDTTSAAGKMAFRIFAVLNEFERDLISERTTGALAYLKSLGKRISGRIPFGFDLADDRESLIVNEREQEGIRLMQDLKADGLSLRKIGAELTERGISTKIGKPWTAQAIKGILLREAA